MWEIDKVRKKQLNQSREHFAEVGEFGSEYKRSQYVSQSLGGHLLLWPISHQEEWAFGLHAKYPQESARRSAHGKQLCAHLPFSHTQLPRTQYFLPLDRNRARDKALDIPSLLSELDLHQTDRLIFTINFLHVWFHWFVDFHGEKLNWIDRIPFSANNSTATNLTCTAPENPTPSYVQPVMSRSYCHSRKRPDRKIQTRDYTSKDLIAME